MKNIGTRFTNRNNMSTLVLLLVAILFSYCSHNKDILEINISSEITDYNSILFLVESANVPIMKDSAELKRFLSPNSMKTAFDSMTNLNTDPSTFRKKEFKDYGTIIKTGAYQTDLLLAINNESKDRDYTFTLLSFDKYRNNIGSLEFASWRQDLHCSGKIDGDTIIEIKCKETGVCSRYKISETGKFIFLTSNNHLNAPH